MYSTIQRHWHRCASFHFTIFIWKEREANPTCKNSVRDLFETSTTYLSWLNCYNSRMYEIERWQIPITLLRPLPISTQTNLHHQNEPLLLKSILQEHPATHSCTNTHICQSILPHICWDAVGRSLHYTIS